MNLTSEQHLFLAYVIGLGLILGYAGCLWFASKRLKRDESDA